MDFLFFFSKVHVALVSNLGLTGVIGCRLISSIFYLPTC